MYVHVWIQYSSWSLFDSLQTDAPGRNQRNAESNLGGADDGTNQRRDPLLWGEVRRESSVWYPGISFI